MPALQHIAVDCRNFSVVAATAASHVGLQTAAELVKVPSHSSAAASETSLPCLLDSSIPTIRPYVTAAAGSVVASGVARNTLP